MSLIGFDVGFDNFTGNRQTDFLFEVFAIFNSIVEVEDYEGDGEHAEDGNNSSNYEIALESVITWAFWKLGNFIRFNVIDAGELGDFLGEDRGGFVGYLLGVF